MKGGGGGGHRLPGEIKIDEAFADSRSQLLGIRTARIEIQNENQTQGKANNKPVSWRRSSRSQIFERCAIGIEVSCRVADPGKSGTVGKLSFWAIDCAVSRRTEVKGPEQGVTAHHASRSCQLLVEMKVSRSAPRPRSNVNINFHRTCKKLFVQQPS